MTNATSMAKEIPTGALRGLRVVDFGHYIPGPLLGMLLADQGADVLKVERPGGDPARNQPAFATWNRGKRSVVIDLKSDSGREQAKELVRGADVLIENFRPGVADRLGIGYEALSGLNPQLIYCSLPGFGEDSPHRDQRGWEPIVSSSTGVYQKVDGITEPLFVPLPVASTFGAILGAVSVGMALSARHHTSVGQRIEVPLHSAVFPAMGRHLVKLHDTVPPDVFGLFRQTMARQYKCADGRYVQNHGMFARFVRQFLGVAGREDWIEEFLGFVGKPVDDETVNLWTDRFASLFMQRSAKDWQEAINAAGGACTVCNTVDEWLVHEHSNAAGMVVEVEDASLGVMKQPGVTVKLRSTPGAVQGRAPKLGEHTREIFSQAAASTPKSLSGSQAKIPAKNNEIAGALPMALDGIRVLDLCLILAGPTCGRTLGEFGADVIKIDDPDRPYDVVASLDVNRGKRSILLDLKSERGQQVFWRLVETADVIVENNRKGSLARLGLGYEDVKRRKPDIVYASLTAFGHDGPWSERAGWEQLAQAASGIQVRRGGRDGVPITLPYPMNDYGTGLLGAYAVSLALHERNTTDRGQSVDGGLALTAGLLQSPYFLDFEGYKRQDLEGLDIRGFSALSRLYQASDGWLYLHCETEEDWRNLTSVTAFGSLASDGRFADADGRTANDQELQDQLGGIFADQPGDHWIAGLNAAGVSLIKNRVIEEFRDDPSIRKAGLIETREHPGRGRADHLGIAARLSATPARLGRPSPVLGGDTKEILEELGYSAEEIRDLESERIVVQTKLDDE